MTTISFKVSEDEARLIRTLAKQHKVTLSEYVRKKATGNSFSTTSLKMIKCPYTKAMIFPPLAIQEPLTNANVKNQLQDFP